MTTLDLAETLNDERLIPLFPLIASVWEDGELTDLEIAAVCLAVIRRPGVDLGCKEALQHWLDPAHPPSVEDLEALRAHISRSSVAASI
jgi:hypothetical protein